MTQLTLIALAHAGGSAKGLVHFRRHLPDAIELRPVDLPGRGSRFSEPLMAARAALVEKLAGTLQRPYALWRSGPCPARSMFMRVARTIWECLRCVAGGTSRCVCPRSMSSMAITSSCARMGLSQYF